MDDSILEKIKENRDPILLSEIGAYLHLLGRFSKEFIESKTENSNNNFNYTEICKNNTFFEQTDLDTILSDNSWQSRLNDFIDRTNLGELLSNKINNFCDFIKKHTWSDNPKGLCKILADAHGIVSGIDKALAGRGNAGKQRREYTYRSTAFGYETEIELLKNPGLKKEFFKKIKDLLERIKNNKFDDDNNYNLYKKFVKLILNYYPKTIGETRRPINEITLFEYAYNIASLMKSNLAKMIIEGRTKPNGKSKWRILKVNIDVIDYISRGLKLGDILGRKEEVENIYEQIKKMIEYEYPLGNEIYRDSTGIYFSMPGLEDQNIENLKKGLFAKIKKLNSLDFDFHLEISKTSRSLTSLGEEREESTKNIIFHHISKRTNLQNVSNKMDICSVCRLRFKDEKKERCEVCKNRFTNRAKDWINNPKKSIWTDEICDHNDRIALIVGQFDIKDWLSGKLVDTFVSQTFKEWKGDLSTPNCNFLTKNMKINSVENLKKKFIDFLEKKINLQEKHLEILDNLLYLPEEVAIRAKDKRCNTKYLVNKFDFEKHFWRTIAETDATGEDQELINNNEKAEKLIKLLFRKHPLIARIQRIWKTTYEFISKTVLKDILCNFDYGKESPKYNLRRKRIELSLQITGNTGSIEYAAYQLFVENLLFDTICVDNNANKFIIIDNLQILPDSLGNDIDSICMKLKGKEGQLKIDSLKYNVKIVDCRKAPEEFQDYSPRTNIYDSPDQFMILVSAWDTPEIIGRIIREYEMQFSKVRDRLPLHIGVVFFQRKTPLFSAMDAGKRILESFKKQSNEKRYVISNIQEANPEVSCELYYGKMGNKVKKLLLKNDKEELTWYMSYATKDPEKEDRWHPYLRVDDNIDITDRTLKIDDPKCVHIKELRKSDQVKVKPSLFSFIFLETNARRFEAGDGILTFDEYKDMNKLWNMFEGFKKQGNLTQTKLKNIETLLSSKKGEWNSDDNYKNLVKTVIKKEFGLDENYEDFSFLEKMINNNLFFRTLEFNLKILKKKLEVFNV